MPYKLKGVRGNRYSVINPETKYVYANSTTLDKAKAQIRLLHMLTKK
jgi:hypothetical protein